MSSLPHPFDLTGRCALVFGGGRGIGRGIALALARAGADVLVSARTREEVEAVAGDVRALGRQGLAEPADATRPEEVERVVSRALAEWEKVDILVVSTGVNLRKPIVPLPGYRPGWAERVPNFDAPTTDEEWRTMVDSHLTAVFLATRAVGPHMLARRQGKVILVTSMTAFRTYPCQVIYGALKSAVAHYARGLALEWARYNIQVNALAPGYVETRMTSLFFEDPAIREKVLRSIPLGRTVTPEEVGWLAVYLASPASDMMTGQVLVLDGGVSL